MTRLGKYSYVDYTEDPYIKKFGVPINKPNIYQHQQMISNSVPQTSNNSINQSLNYPTIIRNNELYPQWIYPTNKR